MCQRFILLTVYLYFTGESYRLCELRGGPGLCGG